MKVRFLEAARTDVTEAEGWYEAEEPGLGGRFLSAVQETITRLIEHPKLGTPSGKKLRLIPLRDFPYSVVYSIREETNEILVVSMAHHRRKPGFWRSRMSTVPGAES
jgi:plasmid stabilization system protein ParE